MPLAASRGWILLLTLSAQGAVAAHEPSGLSTAQSSATLVPAQPGSLALTGAIGSGAMLAGAAMGVGVTFGLSMGYAASTGQASPTLFAGSVVLGVAVSTLIGSLLVPEVTRWSNDAWAVGSPVVARAEAWRYARWAVLANAVGASLLTAGAFLEQQSFGRGQRWMLWGGGAILISSVVYAVLNLYGMLTGYQQSRQRLPFIPSGSRSS